MAKETKKPNLASLKAKITARKSARKAEEAAKWAKMREAAKNPAQIESVMASLVEKSAKQADWMESIFDHLSLHRAAKNAPAKVRVAAARAYGKGFRAIAEGEGEYKPEMLADALTQAYKNLDEQAAAMEIAAEALGIDLGASPVEKAFSEEGKHELEQGEGKGEDALIVVDADENKEEGVPDFEEAAESEGEKKEEPKEEDKPEEKEAAAGSDAFVNDRDNNAQPKAPSKLEIPRSQGNSEVNKAAREKAANDASKGYVYRQGSQPKTAMSKKDYVLIADSIKSSGLAPEQQEAFANHISGSLKSDNSRFMQDRFVDYVMGRGGPSGGRVKAPKAPAQVL